jgi:HK97 family phage major capsid protein
MEQKDAALDAVRQIAEKAKAEDRPLTLEESQEINAKGAEIEQLTEKIKEASKAQKFLDSLGSPKSAEEEKADQQFGGSTLGDYATTNLKDALANIKSQRRGITASTGHEFPLAGVKAPGDPHQVTTTGNGLLEPQIDTNIVRQHVERPTIANWLGSGSITATALKYFVEKAFDPTTGGNFNYVGENQKKPGITFPDYDEVTESLKKVAGWIKISDEMAEDLPFLVTEINNRLLYQLLMFEENELLNGTGEGTSIQGIFNREGIQTEVSGGVDDNLDALYRSLTKVQTATGLTADGVVMHPLDYQALRLSKDANGQYLAGGPFTGSYGQGGYTMQPAIWGQTPIITTAIPQGTALVGAGKQAATVYRKGGIRVETSNIDGEDFTHNRFTVLAEMRELLAVRQPSAFVEVTLATTAGGEG